MAERNPENVTKVLEMLERLGANATTKAIVEYAGVSQQTVDRIADEFGYERLKRGGPWVKPPEPTAEATEIVEALNRIADALSGSVVAAPATPAQMEQPRQALPNESNTLTLKLRRDVTNEMVSEAVGKHGNQRASEKDRIEVLELMASWLFAYSMQE